MRWIHSRSFALLASSLALAVGCAAPAAEEPAAGSAGDAQPMAADTPAGDAAPETGAEATGVTAEPAVGASADAPFQEGGDVMVPVSQVVAAVDAGADIVFVDARPPLDYESGHVAGAISVPYFEAEKHLDRVPRDRWAVVYCECPHAEAQQVADALLAAGYTKVKVIDEGLGGWRDLGREIVMGTPES